MKRSREESNTESDTFNCKSVQKKRNPFHGRKKKVKRKVTLNRNNMENIVPANTGYYYHSSIST